MLDSVDDDKRDTAPLRRMISLLRQSYGPTPKIAIASDEMEAATALVGEILAAYPVAVTTRALKRARLSVPLRHWCLSLMIRHREGVDHIFDRLDYVTNASGRLQVEYDGVTLTTLAELNANVYRTDFTNNILTVEAQIAPGLLFNDAQLTISWVAWQMSEVLEDTGEYAGYHLFGHKFISGRYLRMVVALQPTYPATSIILRATYQHSDRSFTASMSLGYRGASHLARVRGLDWIAGPFALHAHARSISVRHWTPRERVKNELQLYAAILARGVKRGDLALKLKVVIIRAAYWLTRRHYQKKKIWVLHDKMYTASDCGEYMYWYLANLAGDVTPVYAVNRDAPEADRLRRSGAALLYPGTLRQALHYLNAEVVFTTHPNPANVVGMLRYGAFLRDLITAPIVCIQHGLTMQDIARSMHQGHAGIQRYYCASPHEIAHLSQAEYGYRREQLVLTGIPRFDGLPHDSEQIVLVSPTWRPEYAAPSPGANHQRPENEKFLDSLYYHRFSSLLLSENLLNAAEAAGYRIRFMIHPTLAANLGLFRQGLATAAAQRGLTHALDNTVTVVAAGIDTTYDEELKRARLLVTDYSGIQYDFAYMRKALIYFHPTDMPPQYGTGAMDYETMGFGPISEDVADLQDKLIKAIGNDCRVPEGYEPRYNSFFAFDDRGSCRRIYEDVTAWLGTRASREPSEEVDRAEPASVAS